MPPESIQNTNQVPVKGSIQYIKLQWEEKVMKKVLIPPPSTWKHSQDTWS